MCKFWVWKGWNYLVENVPEAYKRIFLNKNNEKCLQNEMQNILM